MAKFPFVVEEQLSRLSHNQRSSFRRDYKKRSKSVGLAYLLWLCLGFHYIYLGKWGTQFLYWVTIGGLGVWILIDLFRIPSAVAETNKDVARELMAQYSQIVSMQGSQPGSSMQREKLPPQW